MILTRRCLLVAARAAQHWPHGRRGWLWFGHDDAEECCKYPKPVLVSVARRWGDPAVAVAAYRAHRCGQATAAWRTVWRVQAALLELARAAGEPDFNTALGEEPERMAMLLGELAEAIEIIERR